jgi:predicted Zn-dependent protease with MMP-like domain
VSGVTVRDYGEDEPKALALACAKGTSVAHPTLRHERAHDGWVDLGEDEFGSLVEQALDGIPPELGRLMRNVAIVVEDYGGSPNLLGLYHGVPLTSRTTQYSGVLPDRIAIYRLPILARCRTHDDVVRQVRITVVHEVAHHFGIDDDRLGELGWA